MDINKVYLGDCLEIMPSIPDKSIDMILCDLPYGTTACKWDTIIPFEPLWKEYKRVIKDNGAIVLTASQPFTSALVMSNIKMFKYCWYWNKQNAGNFATAKYKPLSVIEDICVFAKGRINYLPIMSNAKAENKRPRDKVYDLPICSSVGMASGKLKTSKNHDENLRYPHNILVYNNRADELNALNRLHPTQKPVALFEYLIKTYTNEGDLVLDNCAGSGTTGVACKNLNRNYILIEKEPKYYDIILKRLSETQPRLLDK
jgi:site-specific DNA-methyltransferase (adenine-specific)